MRTYGHFYRFDDAQTAYDGRSTLEIVREPTLGVNNILLSVPDILVIMMNPGSSEPRDCCFNPDPIADVALIHQNAALIDTIPDDTQCSIFQLMEIKRLSHVRVLNLPDIREPNSSRFLRQLTQENPDINGHSIFSEARNHELQLRLPARLRLVVLAWGQDTRLRFLAQRCVAALPEDYRCIGQSTHDNYPLYAHAWQRNARARAEWLDTIINQWP